jgi:hypothetical protein
VPGPGICGGRIATAKGDRARVDIAVVEDPPSLLAGLTIAAAGEGRHGAPIEPPNRQCGEAARTCGGAL